MSKRLVPKHEVGEPVKRGMPLSVDLDAAIDAYWTDKATPEQAKMVVTFLENAREDKKWLACDCQDKNGILSSTPPVMMIGERKSTFYLIRKSGRPEHDHTCPFQISQEEHQQRREQQKDATAPTIDLDKVPQLLGDLNTKALLASPAPATPTSRRFRSAGEESLFMALSWLIEGAGIHRGGHEPLSMKDQWTAISQFLASIQQTPTQTAKDLMILGERHLLDGGYQAQFRAIAAKSDPSRKKVAYLLLMAEKLTRHEDGSTSIDVRRWKKDEAGKSVSTVESVPLYCEVRFPARDNDQAKAPYLVLVKLVETKAGKARASLGVAQPIVSFKNLTPVDSDQERKTYRKLLSIGGYHVKGGGYFEVEKPVRDRNTPLGTCRPDFIVARSADRSKANSLIVETMGFATAEYQERKARTMLIMKHLADDIVEDDRTGAMPDKDADDRLYSSVRSWLKG